MGRFFKALLVACGALFVLASFLFESLSAAYSRPSGSQEFSAAVFLARVGIVILGLNLRKVVSWLERGDNQ